MDLKQLSTKEVSEEGAWLTICDLNGDALIDEKTEKPVRFKIIGSNSKKFKAQQKAQMDAGKKKKNGLSASDSIEYSMRTYTASVIAWEYVVWEKKELDCTPENVRMVLDASEPVLTQVVAFIGEAANFLAN